jgi:hypothetical protein
LDRLSNKTIATLLVIAMVISLTGTFFAIKGISSVTNIITGTATTGTGQADVNITSVTSITLTQTKVDFSSGYRNESVLALASQCNLSSNDFTVPSCWINTTAYSPRDIVLENNGNRYVSITINSTNYSSAFSTCSVRTTIDSGSSNYTFKGLASSEAGACSLNLNTTELMFNNSDQQLCSNLSYADSTDSINITISLKVPAGPLGNCSNAIDFEATTLS